MNHLLTDEAHRYFQEHPILLRLSREFCKKYRSLGHFGGIVAMQELTPRERQDLSLFLRREVAAKDRIRFTEFSLSWQKTRFSALHLEGFLLSFMPKDFSTKQAEQERERKRRQSLYEKMSKNHPKGLAARWLEALHHHELRLSQREFYQQEELLETVAHALDLLPDFYQRLPFFAHQATGNPHAFDHNQAEGRLFLQALAFLAGEPVPADADERTHLMYRFRLLRDDILNFATVYGLAAYDEDGSEIPYWRASAETRSPLNIPLREIVLAEKIVPVGDASQPVHIVENSGVFSALVDTLQAQEEIFPLLALHGQLKAASWALLDRLEKSGVPFLYSGDFDPEGIGIAHRILSRYPAAGLWHMSIEEYKMATVSLPEDRWKKIPKDIHPKLTALAEEMERQKKVLYQESLIENMKLDLLK